MKNERTSKRVASIAGRVLAIDHPHPRRKGIVNGVYVDLTWSDIRALAASALTQTPDKPTRAKNAQVQKPPRKLGKWTRRTPRSLKGWKR